MTHAIHGIGPTMHPSKLYSSLLCAGLLSLSACGTKTALSLPGNAPARSAATAPVTTPIASSKASDDSNKLAPGNAP